MLSAGLVDERRKMHILAQIELEFSSFGQRYAICRFANSSSKAALSLPNELDSPRTWAKFEPSSGGTYPIMQLLTRADSSRLRSLLAHYECSVLRMDNHRVLLAVAQRILCGELEMYVQPIVHDRTAFVQPAPVMAEPQSLMRYARIASPAPIVLGSHSPSTPAKIERSQSASSQFDQRAQAKVLIAAARDGTPFCEECARRIEAMKTIELNAA